MEEQEAVHLDHRPWQGPLEEPSEHPLTEPMEVPKQKEMSDKSMVRIDPASTNAVPSSPLTIGGAFGASIEGAIGGAIGASAEGAAGTADSRATSAFKRSISAWSGFVASSEEAAAGATGALAPAARDSLSFSCCVSFSTWSRNCALMIAGPLSTGDAAVGLDSED